MIARKFRLPSSVVFRSSFFVGENEFFMKTQKNNLSYNRFGFVVGKSVARLATERNRIKRKARSFIEKFWLNTSGGHDILFVFKKGAVVSGEVNEKIAKALRKAGL